MREGKSGSGSQRLHRRLWQRIRVKRRSVRDDCWAEVGRGAGMNPGAFRTQGRVWTAVRPGRLENGGCGQCWHRKAWRCLACLLMILVGVGTVFSPLAPLRPRAAELENRTRKKKGSMRGDQAARVGQSLMGKYGWDPASRKQQKSTHLLFLHQSLKRLVKPPRLGTSRDGMVTALLLRI